MLVSFDEISYTQDSVVKMHRKGLTENLSAQYIVIIAKCAQHMISFLL